MTKPRILAALGLAIALPVTAGAQTRPTIIDQERQATRQLGQTSSTYFDLQRQGRTPLYMEPWQERMVRRHVLAAAHWGQCVVARSRDDGAAYVSGDASLAKAAEDRLRPAFERCHRDAGQYANDLTPKMRRAAIEDALAAPKLWLLAKR
jgi:hypothetical protein